MAELIVKKIVNPFVKEKEVDKIELDLYSKLIKKNKIEPQDNGDIVKDLFSQLMDITEDLRN